MDSIRLVSSLEEAQEVLETFYASDGTLAFDTETTGLQVRSGWHDKGRIIQFSWRPWTEAAVFEMNDRFKDYVLWFFMAAEELVAFNAKFDAHVVHTYAGNLYDMFSPEVFHDVRFLARLNDERDRAALKPLATQYLKEDAADSQRDLKKVMRKNGWDWASVPVQHLVEYGGNDAIITGRLFDLLRPKVAHSMDAYLRELRLQPVLYKMERRGLKVDTEMLDEVIKQERRLVDEAASEVERLAPGLNCNSPIQLKGAFRDLGIELDDTQAPTLKAIDNPLAHAILVYRQHAKTLGTYAEPWGNLITPEGRIHPSFNSMGTVTGRMSSDNPNMQNISKSHRLRDVFIAEEGRKMVVADWDQMELRLYAHFSNDENMRAAFLSGDDIYQQAADLLGVERQVGKMVMLASIYGAGPVTLARQCVSMAYKFDMAELVPALQKFDWKKMYDKFHKAYNIKDLARLTELQARRRGMMGEAYIRTLGGRRQRPKQILKPPVNGYRQKVEIYKDLGNSLVQGSAADLMKMALIQVDEAGLGDYLRLTVHDEMVLEVPDNEVEEVSAKVQAIMTRREFVPPLTVGVGHHQRYGQAK